MPVGRFLLCLHAHMPYVLSHGKSPHGTDWIFESAAECYLPLLDALDRLRNQGIRPRWTICLTPVLAEQLDDASFRRGFEDYCQEKIDVAIGDQNRFRAQGPMWMEGVAAMWQRIYTRALVQFKHQWGRSLCEAFRFFQDEGSIEIVTSAATHGYFPLLGADESIQAQVKVGVDSHVRRFGRRPRGFWLPECAYRPMYDWRPPAGAAQEPRPRKGVESFLAENGIEYFFVDSHMVRGGSPLGTYGAKFPQLAELFARSSAMFKFPAEARSEYEHYALANGTVVFSRDPHTTHRVWSGDVGYPGDPHYLEFHKQLHPGRLRYWRISENKADLGAKEPYDPWEAFERIGGHADDFVNLVKGTLAHYRGVANRTGTLVAMYDAELFGHWWWEGPEFLYEVARAMHFDPDLDPVTGGAVLDAEPPRSQVTLPEGSWGEGGYHYIWLNADNHWTWERLYPAERKMRQMARDYAAGPAHEIVIQAARELLLAESSDWQFLISTWAARDYAEVRFEDHVSRFERLSGMADRAHGGLPLSGDEEAFLRDCQEKDALFRLLDLSYWARLDHPLVNTAGTR
jgi:1,4-alpha-glucan branching enzyme